MTIVWLILGLLVGIGLGMLWVLWAISRAFMR